MPKVSVIIPAYNPGDFLTRAIDSVLQQTMPDLECIVVDDGSTEDLGWVASYGDERLILVRQRNRGVSMARNVGAARSESALVAFLDQDDEWSPRKLEAQLQTILDTPNAAFYYTGFDWVFPTRVMEGDPQAVTYRGLLSNQHVCLSSMIVNRDAYFAVGGHDPLLAQMQDYDLFLRLTMDAPPPALTPARLVRYHVHGGNASADYVMAERERRRILEAHAARAMRAADAATLRATRVGQSRTKELYGYQAMDRVRSSIQARDARAAFRHLTAASRINPQLLVKSAAHSVRRRFSSQPDARPPSFQ